MAFQYSFIRVCKKGRVAFGYRKMLIAHLNSYLFYEFLSLLHTLTSVKGGFDTRRS